MARPLSELRDEIHALSEDDKELLLRELIVELDESFDEDVERAWIVEANKRLAELEEGTVESIPAEDVLERLRSRLAE